MVEFSVRHIVFLGHAPSHMVLMGQDVNIVNRLLAVETCLFVRHLFGKSVRPVGRTEKKAGACDPGREDQIGVPTWSAIRS